MRSLGHGLIGAFVRDEDGGLHTVEFILIGTLVSIGVIVGLAEYRNAVVQEYGDVAAALLQLNQSWSTTSSGSYTDTPPAVVNANGIVVTSPGSNAE